MKILWACGYGVFSAEQSQLIEILTANGNDVEVVEKFQKRHVVKELNTVKNYDVLIISEYLEQQPFEIDILENIIDNFDKLIKIYLLSDEHVNDEYANNLIAIGMSNVLYMKHVSAKNLYDLIQKERGRPEAKQYLGIIGNVTGKIEETINVTAEQIQNILIHIEKEAEPEGRYKVYEHIEKDFNEKENLYILSFFPEELIKELEAHPTVALYKEKGILDDTKIEEVEEASPNKIFTFKKGKTQGPQVVKKSVVKVVEKEVHEKIIKESVGSILIAVGGTKEGAGTTNTAINISKYLRTISKKVAMVEMNDKPVLKGIELKGVDIYAQDYIGYRFDKPTNLLNMIDTNEYSYIILDLGALYRFKNENNCSVNESTAERSLHFSEMNRAQISILVHPCGEWNMKYLTPFVINNDNKNARWKFVLMGTDKEVEKKVKDVFKNFYVASIPFNTSSQETTDCIETLLKEIIELKKSKKHFNPLAMMKNIKKER